MGRMGVADECAYAMRAVVVLVVAVMGLVVVWLVRASPASGASLARVPLRFAKGTGCVVLCLWFCVGAGVGCCGVRASPCELRFAPCPHRLRHFPHRAGEGEVAGQRGLSLAYP